MSTTPQTPEQVRAVTLAWVCVGLVVVPGWLHPLHAVASRDNMLWTIGRSPALVSVGQAAMIGGGGLAMLAGLVLAVSLLRGKRIVLPMLTASALGTSSDAAGWCLRWVGGPERLDGSPLLLVIIMIWVLPPAMGAVACALTAACYRRAFRELAAGGGA